MTRLSVNLNKIALLRNSRLTNTPNVLEFARIALDAGADGLTVHPRPDERHIRVHDVDALAELLREAGYRGCELNLEGNPIDVRFMDIVRRVRPDQCTLVPDDTGQLTSDHGWDVAKHQSFLGEIAAELHQLGARVCVFLEPDVNAVERVPATGADRIELYTEGYARAYKIGGRHLQEVGECFALAANTARRVHLGVNAGHDLDLDNLGPFVALGGILEVSIGHALTVDALRFGMEQSVKRYLVALGRSLDAGTESTRSR